MIVNWRMMSDGWPAVITSSNTRLERAVLILELRVGPLPFLSLPVRPAPVLDDVQPLGANARKQEVQRRLGRTIQMGAVVDHQIELAVREILLHDPVQGVVVALVDAVVQPDGIALPRFFDVPFEGFTVVLVGGRHRPLVSAGRPLGATARCHL